MKTILIVHQPHIQHQVKEVLVLEMFTVSFLFTNEELSLA